MPKTSSLARKLAAHGAGIIAYMLTALLGGAAYVLFFNITGGKAEGLTGGAIVIFTPLVLLAFGLFLWAPAWLAMTWKLGEVRAIHAATAAAVLSVIMIVVMCGGGAGCFLPGRTEHMVGWFIVAFAALGAGGHSATYRRLTRQKD